LSPKLVGDIMVRDVAYVDVPGSRDEVLKTLQKSRVSGVPVVKKGRVVGMITRSDLLKNREEDQIALLMTRDPAVVKPEATVIEASKLLVEHGIRRLPVVEDGKLVGMVTIADVIEVIAEMDIKEKIDSLFERKVVVLWSETPLPVAGEIMDHAQVGACPVIDSSLMLVGIVSDRDLINASIIEDSVDRTDLSQAGEDDGWMWDGVMNTMSLYYSVSRIELKDIAVREAMVPAMTALRGDEVSDVAGVMRKNKIDQLPVVTSSQKLIGLLRDRDLLRALVKHCESTATS
jgi:CBS domain-containing protein